MDKTDLLQKSIDTVNGLVLDYIADPNNVRKRIGIYAFMEDVLTEVHDEAIEAAAEHFDGKPGMILTALVAGKIRRFRIKE